jgi:hypothetical protein
MLNQCDKRVGGGVFLIDCTAGYAVCVNRIFQSYEYLMTRFVYLSKKTKNDQISFDLFRWWRCVFILSQL